MERPSGSIAFARARAASKTRCGVVSGLGFSKKSSRASGTRSPHARPGREEKLRVVPVVDPAEENERPRLGDGRRRRPARGPVPRRGRLRDAEGNGREEASERRIVGKVRGADPPAARRARRRRRGAARAKRRGRSRRARAPARESRGRAARFPRRAFGRSGGSRPGTDRRDRRRPGPPALRGTRRWPRVPTRGPPRSRARPRRAAPAVRRRRRGRRPTSLRLAPASFGTSRRASNPRRQHAGELEGPDSHAGHAGTDRLGGEDGDHRRQRSRSHRRPRILSRNRCSFHVFDP